CLCQRSTVLFFEGALPPAIYTLSLHDALPIFRRLRSALRAASRRRARLLRACAARRGARRADGGGPVLCAATLSERARSRLRNRDRKSTRLNSSHVETSYAVFCLKKKTNESSQ